MLLRVGVVAEGVGDVGGGGVDCVGVVGGFGRGASAFGGGVELRGRRVGLLRGCCWGIVCSSDGVVGGGRFVGIFVGIFAGTGC